MHIWEQQSSSDIDNETEMTNIDPNEVMKDQPDDIEKTKKDEIGKSNVKRNQKSGLRHHQVGSDDEISDPTVVSPTNSPLPSNASAGEVSGEEIFEDAKTRVLPAVIPSSPSFRRKSSPFSMKSWTSLALTLDGRDKITKVIQYVARLLAWWFAGTGSESLSLRYANLYKSLSTSRKAFRLGRSMMEIEKLRNMGLGRLILWHLHKVMGHENNDNDGSFVREDAGPLATRRPLGAYARRASSNIGRGPVTLDEEVQNSLREENPSLLR